jgi:hypothetical protein
MDYIPRTVRSRPNLTQEEALESLQGHPQFKAGTKIKNFTRRGNVWVATIHEPKTAEFPPSEDEESDSKPAVPEDSGDSEPDSDSDDEKDSKPSGEKPVPAKKKPEGDGESKGEEKSEGKALSELTELVHAIADALGVEAGPDKGIPGGPEESPAPVDGPLGPPPPSSGPPGGGGKPKPPMPDKKPKIGPGEAPPGVMPIGTPAFASINGRVASFVAETENAEGLSIKKAKEELERMYSPYKVKQAKRVGNGIKALLSVRH